MNEFIPFEQFQTPLDAYEWAKRNITRLKIYQQPTHGKWWHVLCAPGWPAVYSLVPAIRKASK